ncbi:MAG: aldo/keto reductase [Clostridia bacterium]|nr:aldo/keto reductase [Clostridia bacterium]
MKKLGFGLMRLPRIDPKDRSSIDVGQVMQMADEFIDAGFTYFDTAWMYCGFKSEEAVRPVLTERRKRSGYTLATKFHAAFAKEPGDVEAIFSKQLEKTGAGYFDYYLYHDLNRDNYAKCIELGAFGTIGKKKEEGLIRTLGCSFHDTPEILDKVLTEHPELEFVQLQINYLDWDSPAIRARECYEVARRHGKPVIVMEPVKGGTLAAVPPAAEAKMKALHPDWSVASWAIRFAASLDGVMIVLSGMSNLDQLRENIGYMKDFSPLGEDEMNVIREVVGIINSDVFIPCTGCAYCVDGCPMNIPIPKYFSLYNADRQEIATKEWTPQREYYDNLTNEFGAAGECIGCGQCEGICPQHLGVTKFLKDVAEYFGK